MREYPKRIYPGGRKGVTVHSREEEDRLLGRRPEPAPAAAPQENRADPSLDQQLAQVEAPGPQPVAEPPAPGQLAEDRALEYIMSKGYGKKKAKEILKEHGIERISADFQKEQEEEKLAAEKQQETESVAPAATEGQAASEEAGKAVGEAPAEEGQAD